MLSPFASIIRALIFNLPKKLHKAPKKQQKTGREDNGHRGPENLVFESLEDTADSRHSELTTRANYGEMPIPCGMIAWFCPATPKVFCKR